MKKYFPKIKKVIKEKDSRFWLMIFVVVSTLAVFVIWISDFDNIFVNNKTARSSEFDFKAIREESMLEFNKNFDEFSTLLEESFFSIEEDDSNNLNLILEKSVLDKIKEKELEKEKLEEKTEDSMQSVDELRESEENIESLRKKIEELEREIDKDKK